MTAADRRRLNGPRRETRPLRVITDAHLMSGRGSVLGPDNHRRVYWWESTLSCGHVEEVPARYGPRTDGKARGQARGKSDILPAPKRARCNRCPRSTP